jgi:hypothetical protein
MAILKQHDQISIATFQVLAKNIDSEMEPGKF